MDNLNMLNLQKEKEGADKIKGCDTSKEYADTLEKLAFSKLFKAELPFSSFRSVVFVQQFPVWTLCSCLNAMSFR